jgi:uncharacterized protein
MAEKIRPLDFDEMCDWLVSIDSQTSPSELHGYLAGQLSAGRRLTDKQWLNEAQEVLDSDKGFTVADEEVLHCVYANVLAALMDDEFGFYPLLPEDSVEVEERIESIALWSQGFLAGFAMVEKAISQLSDLVNDALHDLAAISQLNSSDEQEFDDGTDDDLMNIVEYVRLAAMNIFAEYAPQVAEKVAEQPAAMTAQSLFRNRQLH